jgi:hypothetical protein
MLEKQRKYIKMKKLTLLEAIWLLIITCLVTLLIFTDLSGTVVKVVADCYAEKK